MTPEQKYLELALNIQTHITFKIIQRLGEELFPGDQEKIDKLHLITREAFEEVHRDTAGYVNQLLARDN